MPVMHQSRGMDFLSAGEDEPSSTALEDNIPAIELEKACKES